MTIRKKRHLIHLALGTCLAVAMASPAMAGKSGKHSSGKHSKALHEFVNSHSQSGKGRAYGHKKHHGKGHDKGHGVGHDKYDNDDPSSP